MERIVKDAKLGVLLAPTGQVALTACTLIIWKTTIAAIPLVIMAFTLGIQEFAFNVMLPV